MIVYVYVYLFTYPSREKKGGREVRKWRRGRMMQVGKRLNAAAVSIKRKEV